MQLSSQNIMLPRGTKVPNHIVIIPDGNRRWARSRGLPTLFGHKAGFERAVELSRKARDWGVHTVTLWGFSTDNWDRSKEEVNYLMKIYVTLLNKYLEEAKRDGVRLIHLGRKDRLPEFLLKRIRFAEEETKNNKKYIANLALDYGGRDDIIRAVRRIIDDKIPSKKVDEKLFDKYLDTHDQPYPYPDMIIRTSGEQRTSGILLWQAHYAETYWENVHFPDFTAERLRNAILDYSRRRRRFGGNDAMEHLKFKPEMVAKFELAWWRLSKIPEGMRFRDYAARHLREQFGLSAILATEAAKYMIEGFVSGQESKWEKATRSLRKFYKLVRDEIKLAFEPSLVASLEVKLQRDLGLRDNAKSDLEIEKTASELYAEVYRINLLQAAKLAHLRVLANVERNLAMSGLGEHHWERAEEYLQRFYRELKDRVA